MDEDEVCSIPKTTGWDQNTRAISDSSLGSITSTKEQLALVGFASQLCSVSTINDPSISEENDVRKEAQLLMSLSCITPSNITVQSGRITPPPPSDTSSSCNSLNSRNRDSFRFSCPSLSLEDRSQDAESQHRQLSSSGSATSQCTTESVPAALLGRVLKVDDRDALRLSSEAMVRNIMQSYEKGIQWRIQSWIEVLSKILVDKEKELRAQGLATEENLRLLCGSSEAIVIVHLRELSKEIKVAKACNNFKVLPQRAPESEPLIKKQRSFDDHSADAGLEEAEYEYTVSHLLSFECDLNIHAPAVGHASINLQVPGTMKGTFFSLEDGEEHLADVFIDLNTNILASMIEKSSRMVVRSSIEALLMAEQSDESSRGSEEEPAQEAKIEEDLISEAYDSLDEEEEAPIPSCTPKRKFSEQSVSGLVVVTPRDSSSPSSIEDSDSEDRPVILSIPHNFSSDQPNSVLAPLSSRARNLEIMSSFSTRLPAMKKSKKNTPNVVTPSKTVQNFVEGKGPGPNLPTLLEAALQLHAT